MDGDESTSDQVVLVSSGLGSSVESDDFERERISDWRCVSFKFFEPPFRRRVWARTLRLSRWGRGSEGILWYISSFPRRVSQITSV